MSTIRFMIRSLRQLACLALVLLSIAGCKLFIPPAPSVQPASAEAIRSTVTYLSDDAMEGRGFGTDGLDHAAQYIAGYFRGLGLQPEPGHADYLQTFTKTFVTGVDSATSLKVNSAPVKAADYVPLSNSAEASFDAAVVFVGYGISATTGKAPYDDYAGVDVKGKVALAMASEPCDEKGRSRLVGNARSGYSSPSTKARIAADRGAVALILVHPPKHKEPESLPQFRPRSGSAAAIPVIQIKQQGANDLFRRAGAKSLKEYQADIDAAFSPRSFVLRKTRLAGQVTLKRQDFTFKNVVAFLPGSGLHDRQYIVIGAHYDHMGRGPVPSTAPATRAFYPGADDNASGTAAMIELARLFSQARPGPRSLLFVAFSAEEVGLHGSQYWIDHPPVSIESITAMINLDMVGRVRDRTITIGGSGTAGAWPGILSRSVASSTLRPRYSWNNGIAPSDNATFARKRIPVLFFNSGSHPDLHRPTDTADKIDYNAAAQVVDLVADVIRRLSTQANVTFTESPTTMPATRPN